MFIIMRSSQASPLFDIYILYSTRDLKNMRNGIIGCAVVEWGCAVVEWGVRRSRAVTFAAIRLRGPWFKTRPGHKFETRFLLHSHPSGGEGVSPVQGEAIRCRYIKPEYLSYRNRCRKLNSLMSTRCHGVCHAMEEQLFYGALHAASVYKD